MMSLVRSLVKTYLPLALRILTSSAIALHEQENPERISSDHPLLGDVRRFLEANPLVKLTMPQCSGKSTLAYQLYHVLEGEGVQLSIIELDSLIHLFKADNIPQWLRKVASEDVLTPIISACQSAHAVAGNVLWLTTQASSKSRQQKQQAKPSAQFAEFAPEFRTSFLQDLSLHELRKQIDEGRRTAERSGVVWSAIRFMLFFGGEVIFDNLHCFTHYAKKAGLLTEELREKFVQTMRLIGFSILLDRSTGAYNVSVMMRVVIDGTVYYPHATLVTEGMAGRITHHIDFTDEDFVEPQVRTTPSGRLVCITTPLPTGFTGELGDIMTHQSK
jgi:hypothetical protein